LHTWHKLVVNICTVQPPHSSLVPNCNELKLKDITLFSQYSQYNSVSAASPMCYFISSFDITSLPRSLHNTLLCSTYGNEILYYFICITACLHCLAVSYM